MEPTKVKLKAATIKAINPKVKPDWRLNFQYWSNESQYEKGQDQAGILSKWNAKAIEV